MSFYNFNQLLICLVLACCLLELLLLQRLQQVLMRLLLLRELLSDLFQLELVKLYLLFFDSNVLLPARCLLVVLFFQLLHLRLCLHNSSLILSQ